MQNIDTRNTSASHAQHEDDMPLVCAPDPSYRHDPEAQLQHQPGQVVSETHDAAFGE